MHQSCLHTFIARNVVYDGRDMFSGVHSWQIDSHMGVIAPDPKASHFLALQFHIATGHGGLSGGGGFYVSIKSLGYLLCDKPSV